ncbi:hypothetical protein NSP_25690 [Nodularia spumigena CCY9414]|nr:hypothetical protein NSP_25690 [Nodularia spumigena CCY9414]
MLYGQASHPKSYMKNLLGTTWKFFGFIVTRICVIVKRP